MKSFDKLNATELRDLQNSVEWISNYPEKYINPYYNNVDLCTFFNAYRTYICNKYHLQDSDPAKVLLEILFHDTINDLWSFYSGYDWFLVKLKN